MLTKHIRANGTTVLDKLELRPFCALFSGVTMGWLLRLVTGGPLVVGPPTVLEFLVINFRGRDLRK